MPLKLPKLDKTMAVVTITVRRKDPKTGQMITEELEGIPSPDFQRFWQSAVIKTDDGTEVAGDKVTQLNSGTYPATTASGSYSQSQMQDVMNALHTFSDAFQR